MASKSKALELKTKNAVKAIIESNENANLLVDILELSDSSREKEIRLFIRSVNAIFNTLIGRLNFFKQTLQPEATSNEKKKDPEDVFNEWIYDKYTVTLKKLLSFMDHESNSVAELSLCTLMKLVRSESKARGKLTAGGKPAGLSNSLFCRVIASLIDGKKDKRDLIQRFTEFLVYSDVKYFTLKNLSTIVKVRTGDEENFLSQNVYQLLDAVDMTENEEESKQLFVECVGDSKKKRKKKTEDDATENEVQLDCFSETKLQIVFSSAWLSFLQLKISSDLHKKILMHLHSKVMPYMSNPKLLMDFLTDSYNIGGPASLLALNGLFILIHKYNLDYPDFYKKLYALLEPGIFHAKYSARFFHLADLFLSSTHLPLYLVAAFCKRLVRLALSAPVHGVMLVVPFVNNLIRRHPNCKVLIQKVQPLQLHGEKDTTEEGAENKITDQILGDPFDFDEADPAKCAALESSLWELKTLQEHYYPGVSLFVKLFEQPYTKVEKDISEYLEIIYDELFEKECTSFNLENSALEFQPPKGLLGKDMMEFWTVETS